jgi:polygalacturonase
MKRTLALGGWMLTAATVALAEGEWSVRDFGALGDGKTDDTAAFQKALVAAGTNGGGIVHAPRGNYFFTVLHHGLKWTFSIRPMS